MQLVNRPCMTSPSTLQIFQLPSGSACALAPNPLPHGAGQRGPTSSNADKLWSPTRASVPTIQTQCTREGTDGLAAASKRSKAHPCFSIVATSSSIKRPGGPSASSVFNSRALQLGSRACSISLGSGHGDRSLGSCGLVRDLWPLRAEHWRTHHHAPCRSNSRVSLEDGSHRSMAFQRHCPALART